MARKAAIAIILLLATLAFYLHDQKTNPPGFYLDEASIALNAVTIARYGVDEFGTAHPFYFRAFGEYKNPVYIYALAGVFNVLYPSDLVARRFSAILGWLGAIAIGALAWRVTRRPWTTATMFLLAALTPALFEISRLAFEVALFPLAIALFLIAVHTAHTRVRWSAGLVLGLVASLAFVNYSYTAGRMLAPIYAAGLLLFYTRERRNALIATLALFALTSIAPVLLYNYSTDGALLARGRDTSYFIFLKDHPTETIAAFERNVVQNLLPVGMAVKGDPNGRHHVVDSGGCILGGTFILAIAAIWLIWKTRPLDRWWLFVLFGTVVSVLPAAITNDVFHILRLAAYVVFVLVLAMRTLESARPRSLVITAFVLAGVQFAWFLHAFHKHGPHRDEWFNTGAKQIVYAALERGEPRVYVQGLSISHAQWYAEINGVSRDQFQWVESAATVPAGGLLVSPFPCDECDELLAVAQYKLFRRR